MTSWQTAVGLVLSSTVTVAVQVEVLPLTSVTVRVTVLAPTFEQLKLDGATLIPARPQLSEEPLLMSDAVIVAEPLPSRATVMSRQIAVGAILSSTVTIAVQDEVLPVGSVAVRVTLLLPTSLQLKLVWLATRLLMLQLSELPPSMSATVIDALPEAYSWTVTLWQTTVGQVLSTTVTVAVQEEVLLLTSVTVRVTLLGPILEQLKEAGATLTEESPQLSAEPLLMSDAVIEAAGGGFDNVYSSVDYLLDSSQEIESAILTGNAVVLRGDDSANQLFGNDNVNVLEGKLGTDYLLGLGGDDIFQVSLEANATDLDVFGDFEGAGVAGGDRIALDASIWGMDGIVSQVSQTSFIVSRVDGSNAQQFIIANLAAGNSGLLKGDDYYFG